MEQNVLDYDKEKLERFILAVNEEVEKDAVAMLNKANETASDLISQAKREAKEQAQLHEEESLRRLKSKTAKRLAKAELDSKKQALLCRKRLTKELFSEVREMLCDFTETPDYEKYLLKQVSLCDIKEGAVICLNNRDMKYSGALKKAGIKCPFEADDSIQIGGFSVFYPETGLLDNRTLDLKLEEAESDFRRNNSFEGNSSEEKRG